MRLGDLASEEESIVPQMLILKQLILGLLLPAVVGGGILILAKSIASKKESEEKKGLASGWLVAIALSAGYTVGYIGLEGFPPFPPREGVHWLCYLAIIGLVSGAFWHSSRWGRLIVQIALSIIIPRLLLNSAFNTWGQFEGVLWWVCLAVAVFIFWHIVQESFTILPAGGSSAFVYFGLSGGTALILAVSGSLRLAQHAGILVAIFVASWILTLVGQRSDNNKWQVFPLGASPVVALLLSGIWMNGYFYEEVPAVSAMLLAIALFLAPVGRIEQIQRLGARRSTIVQIATIALPVLIAIGIAIARSGLFGENSGY